MREMLSCKTCWVAYFDKLTYCVSTDCVAHAKLLVTTTTTVEGLPKRNTMHATTSAQKQREYVEQLQADITALQARLGEGENAETIASNHIKLLHRYNEAKDATQILVGRLASLKGTTVRQIYIDMDLLDDAN